MAKKATPSFESFLEASPEKLAAIAPKTMIFAAGGTRRSAVMAGISDRSDEYVRWTRRQMIGCFDMLFRYGISHILTFAIIESQMQEVTERYRQRLLRWVDWGLAGPEALADYQRLGWRVRLQGTEALQELAPSAQRLEAETASDSAQTVWWFVTPDADLPWQRVLKAAALTGATTRPELVEAVYGERIPPATLFLSFGKPMLSASLLPPLLTGRVQCYWMQQPGYRLDDLEWRRILYDYAYLRSTWREDKTGRANAVLDQSSVWSEGPTLGLGMRLGPYWYPAPFPKPSIEEEDGNL